MLVVDDSEAQRRLLVLRLQGRGCRTAAAADAGQAVEILESGRRFDLVISDFRMPEKDGLGLLEWVQDRFPGTAVALMSGWPPNPSRRHAAKHRAIPMLLKPITDQDLDAILLRAHARS